MLLHLGKLFVTDDQHDGLLLLRDDSMKKAVLARRTELLKPRSLDSSLA